MLQGGGVVGRTVSNTLEQAGEDSPLLVVEVDLGHIANAQLGCPAQAGDQPGTMLVFGDEDRMAGAC